MYQIDINKPVHIHFIGIGGISMSGLAGLLKSKGFTVSGSDRQDSDIVEKLREMGIKIFIGQGAANITDDIDVVVYTAAIHPDNPEYAECVKRGLPMMERAALLGQLCKFFETAIGVAGTHGKTTTTSMMAHILLAADADPTISVGGILPAIGGNLKIGEGKDFLFEACEYTNSFLKFFPTDEIILNVEADHLDFFKDLNEIRQSFNAYAKLVPANGHVVINGEIANYEEIVAGVKGEVITYGMTELDSEMPEHDHGTGKNYNYTAKDIKFDEFGCASFTVIKDGAEDIRVTLGVPGVHNVSNALSVIALAKALGFSDEAIVSGLKAFSGTDRRFQKKGEVCGVTIIDDYAHHPTEISATLATAKKYKAGEVWVVFQPHTFSRTLALRQEFVEALKAADKVVLAKIYAAREVDNGEISSYDLCEDLQSLGVESYYFDTFDEIENFLLKNCVNGDMLITMGAGDVYKIGEHLLGN